MLAARFIRDGESTIHVGSYEACTYLAGEQPLRSCHNGDHERPYPHAPDHLLLIVQYVKAHYIELPPKRKRDHPGNRSRRYAQNLQGFGGVTVA